MSYNRVWFSDHLVERPNTYTMVQNDDGTVTLVPAFGRITNQGTALNAENMNTLDTGIAVVSQDIDKLKYKLQAENLKSTLDLKDHAQLDLVQDAETDTEEQAVSAAALYNAINTLNESLTNNIDVINENISNRLRCRQAFVYTTAPANTFTANEFCEAETFTLEAGTYILFQSVYVVSPNAYNVIMEVRESTNTSTSYNLDDLKHVNVSGAGYNPSNDKVRFVTPTTKTTYRVLINSTVVNTPIVYRVLALSTN